VITSCRGRKAGRGGGQGEGGREKGVWGGGDKKRGRDEKAFFFNGLQFF